MSRKIIANIRDLGEAEVEGPDSWSDKAIGIAAKLYFAPGEMSVYDMVNRVVNRIASFGNSLGYFGGDLNVDEFKDKLYDILISQRAAFNSPVWMNIGVPNRDEQAWACLILDVEDSMESIRDGWNIESETFRNGSGSGVNISKIRANGELLSDGAGVGSGPISLWMRPTDAIAGVVRSGGRTRRAAKMVIMDSDHPEILDFIRLKSRAESMARDLANLGYDITMNGKDSPNIPFQNANNSVRVTDSFMRSVVNDNAWNTTYRTNGDIASVIPARTIWDEICKAAWECGDPGLQFHDTINEVNTVKNDGEIIASNPCSEYMFLGNTVCNLASINLIKYLVKTTFDRIDWDLLAEDVQALTIAMDILVDLSSYPNAKIEETSKRYRTLGLGFTNLGALLMSLAIPYDSEEGRNLAADIMSYIQVVATAESQLMARVLGAFPAYGYNKDANTSVISRQRRNGVHQPHSYKIWADIDPEAKMRNAQISVIAPTGTISLMMDCETTGIEPVIAIDAKKTLVGGGTMNVGVSDCVSLGMIELRKKNPYATYDDIVFQTAIGSNTVSPKAHVLMMAAVQPFVSGAISKTVNLPSSASIEDVSEIYKLAWSSGCKAIAIYRDGCKAYQPVNIEKIEEKVVEHNSSIIRRRPAGTRKGITHKFEIAGQEYYLILNRYEDGDPCEIFIISNRHGSPIAGWVQAFSMAISKGLQHGIPFSDFASSFRHMNFMPQGFVNSDSKIKMADSPLDYIIRFIESNLSESEIEKVVMEYKEVGDYIGLSCSNCGSTNTVRAGTCMLCRDCAETSGCS